MSGAMTHSFVILYAIACLLLYHTTLCIIEFAIT